MSSVFLQGGHITTADSEFIGDLLIIDGKVAAVGPSVECPAGVEKIDCTGKYVMPGGIDPHTHIQMPAGDKVTADDWFTGPRAAAAGGTTCVIDFVPCSKDTHPGDILNLWTVEAKKSIIDYTFHMSVVDWNDEVRASLQQALDLGIISAKCYLAYKGRLSLDNTDEFIQFFHYCREHGMLPLVHCEDGDMVPYLQDKLFAEGQTTPAAHPKSRPGFVEGDSAHHAISIAKTAGSPVYIVHNTCHEAIEALQDHQNELPVFGEATITHLVYNDSMNDIPDFDKACQYVLSPPLRPESDRLALWDAVQHGIIKTLCTDHCPWTLDQKREGKDDFRKIMNGVPAIEERMVLFWSYGVSTGKISPSEFVAITSANAAKIFGMYPQKGALSIGSDGDVVVFDPNAKRTIKYADQKSAIDYNIFEGIEVHGVPVLTLSRGKKVWQCQVKDGVAQYKEGFLGEERVGQFVRRQNFVPFVYGRLHQ